MTEEEIIKEIHENETVEEEEDNEDGGNENEIAVKPRQQEIQQDMQRLVNFSPFTESGEIKSNCFEGVFLN